MKNKGEAWYIHSILYVIIAILVVVLIKVAYIDPSEVIEQEKTYKQESRLRMENIREVQKLWQLKFGKYTDNLDSLITFAKTDPSIEKIKTGVDTLTGRSTNPFRNLLVGSFVPDSLYFSPKSHKSYLLQVDSSEQADTIIDRRGKILKIETVKTTGKRYYIACPDGYGTIGDVDNDALKNTASWE
ncbi:MAG: hypothetical protein KF816_14410 [Melioribacteraceae bacterium]|nr:hypothetical protein [Melioribacteraceae bacterium]